MAAAATSDPHLASVSASASASSPPPTLSSQPAKASTKPSITASITASTSTDHPPESSSQLPSTPPPVFSLPSSPRPASIASPGALASPASPTSPTTRPSRGASTSSSTASFSPSGLFNRSLSAKRPIRRQSTQDRLNEILENARHRAESYAAAAAASSSTSPNASNTAAPGRRATFRMEPLLRNQSAPGAFAGIAEQYESESADETTGINRRANRGSNRHNYQTTAATGTGTGTGTATTTSTYGSVSAPASASRSSSGPRARKNGGNDQNRDRDQGGGGASRGASRTASIRSRNMGGGATPATTPRSRWKDFWAGFQSIELENKGSVARDHLALERTFLAWLRTSLAFASIGIAVTQLFRLNTTTEDENSSFNSLRHVGRPLGTTFLGISVLVLFLGYHRYYQSQQWILKGKFPASRGTILIVSLVAFALMVTSLVVVVVVQPS